MYWILEPDSTTCYHKSHFLPTKSSICVYRNLTLSNPTETAFTGYSESVGYDRIVQLWNPGVYEFAAEADRASRHVFSQIGKYSYVKLLHKESKELHMHVSVHLPHKKGRDKAQKLLRKAIEKQVDNVDQVFVHGDFNTDSSRLGNILPDFTFAVTGEQKTTKKGSQTDNVGAFEGIDFESVNLDNDAPYSHFPLTVAVALATEAEDVRVDEPE